MMKIALLFYALSLGQISNVHVGGNLTVDGSITGAGSLAFKGYSDSTEGTGLNYLAGFYQAPAAEKAFTQAALTQTYGSANNAYGAHAFFVAKGDGVTDGSTLVLTVTGISITDAGVRNGSASEVIVGAGAHLAGCANGGIIANMATDVYCETNLKWLGQITYTLSSSGGATFNLSGNYGHAKYDDFGNRALTLTDVECVWHAGANETNFGIRFLHHNSSNWTYHVSAFVPGGTVIASLDADYSTDDEFDTGEYGAYKRSGLSEAIDGSASEGLIIETSTAVNNSIADINCHVGGTL